MNRDEIEVHEGEIENEWGCRKVTAVHRAEGIKKSSWGNSPDLVEYVVGEVIREYEERTIELIPVDRLRVTISAYDGDGKLKWGSNCAFGERSHFDNIVVEVGLTNPKFNTPEIKPFDLEISTTRQGIIDGLVEVRITHKPTGIAASAIAKSELQARESAMSVLRDRIKNA